MSKKDSKLVDLVKRWRVEWAIATAGTYFVAIIVLVFVFPDVSNLWISVFVLASGFTASLSTLGDLLVNAEETSTPEQDSGGVIDNKGM